MHMTGKKRSNDSDGFMAKVVTKGQQAVSLLCTVSHRPRNRASEHLSSFEGDGKHPLGSSICRHWVYSLMPGMRAARACLSWSLLPDWASWSAAGPVSCIVKLVGCPCTSAFLHSDPLRHGPLSSVNSPLEVT